uniref:Uncharacterized protein n=1 Tax=Meloidogyne javanica TaxID=6303 RepID=A0A915MCR6_MELJA
MSSSSQSSETEEEKIQEKPKVVQQKQVQKSPQTERPPWKHRKKSQKESLEKKKAALEEKLAKEKQEGLIKRSSIDLGRRHVATSGQKDHPSKIDEQGSQGSESAATVVERSPQVQLPGQIQSPTDGRGMSIKEWRRFSKG